MSKLILAALNTVLILYLSVAAILYLLHLPFFILYFLATGSGQLDDAFRVHNRRFGIYLVRVAWPYIRVEMNRSEHLKKGVAYIVVTNHRTYADVFFSALIPVVNQVATVRSWPFKLKLFGWSMRLANYIDIERTSLERLSDLGGEYKQRQVSVLFYPEGHRSRDGRLQRFRKGAFKLAVERDMPVLPICMTGTEEFASKRFPYLHPTRVKLHIMAPIQPAAVADAPDRITALRDLVESRFRSYLGE